MIKYVSNEWEMNFWICIFPVFLMTGWHAGGLSVVGAFICGLWLSGRVCHFLNGRLEVWSLSQTRVLQQDTELQISPGDIVTWTDLLISAYIFLRKHPLASVYELDEQSTQEVRVLHQLSTGSTPDLRHSSYLCVLDKLCFARTERLAESFVPIGQLHKQLQSITKLSNWRHKPTQN